MTNAINKTYGTILSQKISKDDFSTFSSLTALVDFWGENILK
jgi:hypothetical protein